MLRRLAILTMLTFAVSAALPAQAQEGDVAAGRRLAATWCASCHFTGTGTPGSAADAAPSFRSIAARPTTTAASLRAFLRTQHAAMPDFHLSRSELEDMVALILSLREK